MDSNSIAEMIVRGMVGKKIAGMKFVKEEFDQLVNEFLVLAPQIPEDDMRNFIKVIMGNMVNDVLSSWLKR